MQKSTNMPIKMTLRASTQINIFLYTIFSFEFFGWSLKNLRNVEFLAEKQPWVFFNLEFFRPWVFWKRSKKSLAYKAISSFFRPNCGNHFGQEKSFWNDPKSLPRSDFVTFFLRTWISKKIPWPKILNKKVWKKVNGLDISH